ncbi:MAG: YybS family protein [Clostridia bacterium]|nr:YybS family protein [Clostridia bacterium]
MYFMILIILLFAVPLIWISINIHSAKTAWRILLECILGIASGSLLVFIVSAMTGYSLADILSQSMQLAAGDFAKDPQMSALFGMSGLSDTEKKAAFESMATLSINTLPSMLLLWGAIISYVEYLILERLFALSGRPVSRLGALADFSFPKNAMWGFMIIFVLSMLVSFMKLIEDSVFLTNINLIIEYAFCLQGISLLFFMFRQKRWPKVFAAVITIIFLLNVIGQTLLFLIGGIDLFFGIKQKIRAKAEK